MIALAASARALRVFQVMWVIGFLVGTTTHAADLIVGGLDAYSAFPTADPFGKPMLTVPFDSAP